MKLAIASDHAGYELKIFLIEYFKKKKYSIKDFGAYSEESSDYADFAHPLAREVSDEKVDYGISICGSGNGINMTVNKYPKIRSALCWNVEIAKLARSHNNANICALPARFIGKELAKKIVKAFLSTTFEGGRHERRINKIPIN